MSTPNAMRPIAQQHRMSNTNSGTPTKSSKRRVLGELTPNARVSSTKAHQLGHGKARTMDFTSTLKKPLAASPATLIPREQARSSSPAKAGVKRSFEDFESNASERASHDLGSKRPMTGEVLREGSRPVPKPARPAVRTAADMVDLPDDLSSTDEDTPPPQALAISQDTVASKASFSSLIDYNPAEASDRSESASSSPSIQEPTVKSQAEALRLRLRVALYKVRTNQTRVPLSRLQISPHATPQPRQPNISSSTLSATTQSSTKEPLPSQLPSIVVSASNPSPPRATPAPQLLPAPVLRPTAYSSRFVVAPHIPSSPPEVIADDESGEVEGVSTPEAARRAVAQLGTPPKNADRRSLGTERQSQDKEEGRAARAARAASEPLELMRQA